MKHKYTGYIGFISLRYDEIKCLEFDVLLPHYLLPYLTIAAKITFAVHPLHFLDFATIIITRDAFIIK